MENVSEREIQLSTIINTAKPRSILAGAKTYFKAAHPESDFCRVEKVFLLTKRLYDGRMPGYLACAVEYHDYAHCVSVFAASSRILDGCELSGLRLEPEFSVELLIAALLHDTGYIREEADDWGTGAQFTKVHVNRSAAFVRREARVVGLTVEAADRVARMILATDLARPWAECVFAGEGERMAAEILAAADLLGQMADRAYLEKLLFLYNEFREAGIAGYDTTFDILRKTAGFYESTKARLDGPLGRVSGKVTEHFAQRHGLPRNLYREAVIRQMAYLETIIADDSGNFRNKLRRLDLATKESLRA